MYSLGLSLCILATLLGVQGIHRVAEYTDVYGAYTGPGYYWRDFDDRIPDDAFPTGNGNYFIGQLVYSKTLVPALIIKDGSSIMAEYSYAGQPYTQNKDFQLFCTTDASQFEWLRTDVENIHDLMFDRHFIIGGSDDGLPTFIGRASGGKIGKVSTYPRWPGLIYVRGGQSVRDYNYDVLVYRE